MQGYGLTLTNNKKGPLAKLKLLGTCFCFYSFAPSLNITCCFEHTYIDDCIKLNCPSNCHWIFDPHGAILGYFGRLFKDLNPQNVDKNSEFRGNLRIPRQTLRQLILNRLKKDTIVWDHAFSNYIEAKDSVTVQFSKGQSIECVSFIYNFYFI